MEPCAAGDTTVPPLRPSSAGEGIRQRCRRRARKLKEATRDAASAAVSALFAGHAAGWKKCRCCGAGRRSCRRSGRSKSVYVAEEQSCCDDLGDVDCCASAMDCVGEILRGAAACAGDCAMAMVDGLCSCHCRDCCDSCDGCFD